MVSRRVGCRVCEEVEAGIAMGARVEYGGEEELDGTGSGVRGENGWRREARELRTTACAAALQSGVFEEIFADGRFPRGGRWEILYIFENWSTSAWPDVLAQRTGG